MKDIVIHCSENQLEINGVELAFPVHLNTLIEIFGEPSQQTYHEILWYVVWDDLGVSCTYGSWDNILSVEFHNKKSGALPFEPETSFKGTLKIDGTTVVDPITDKKKLGVFQINPLHGKGEADSWGFSIGKNYEARVEIPKDKYLISPVDGEIIEFEDFNFKLAIIQELMYNQDVLKPKFDCYEFAEWYEDREIDIEKEGHDFIPEVVRYFKELPVEKRYALQIKEIYQDGGDEIYLNLLRFGSGATDVFDISRAEDAGHFPNLKKVTLCYAEESVLDELKRMGIEAEWL